MQVEAVSGQVGRGEWWVVDDGRAVSVHGPAVDLRCSGSGIGRAVLDWVSLRRRAGHRELLRLDCAATDPGLVRYDERPVSSPSAP